MIGLNLALIFLFATYPWPIREFYGVHPVSGVIGDGRDVVLNPRFHRGIDIPGGPGTDVFSIYSGTAYQDGSSGPNAWVRVGEHWYMHLFDDVLSIPVMMIR
ncbi:MAG: M23 family metallopeptidase [candidate division WOR-3 bacterium]|nr:M23 family metallopeptidase [candidate division WOR-3 bacterium]